MRYLPAVWTFMRTPLEDIRLGDHVVEEGSFIFISPFVTQRDPRFFDDPLTFRPERFLPEAEKAIPKGAYVPFSAGPRVCAGKAFAMMEARLILGTFLKHLVAELPVDYEFGIIPLLSLHPKNGLTMQVRRHEPEGMRAASK
jgi:cytochrome P450